MHVKSHSFFERWLKLSLVEQLANVGSDVERTIKWRRLGDEETAMKAFYRALEQLDYTIADPKNNGSSLKEVVRTREALVDHFVYDNEFNTTTEQWQNYFYQLTYFAALKRGR